MKQFMAAKEGRAGEMQRPGKTDLLVPRGWIQAVAVVVLFGFFVLGLLAYRTYSGEAPIPERVLGPNGTLFTRQDILAGQQLFLRYLGPDFTADYLRRQQPA
jgi:nitric oxide reductase subunit B